ncbi:Fe2+-dicitrate sensor, membrane component [plant metagenome]|uniref:Fe2+-dicitrate sensor, membrane component n=1 Tax=plant metagenome TaxID=1297885 RepID=A0A484T0P7_9ZZZZ
MSTKAVAPSVAAREAAIAWQICLSSGDATDADRYAFERWLAATPLNQQAWRHLEAALGKALHGVEPGLLSATAPLRRSLVGPRNAMRRKLGRLLLFAGVIGGAGVGADRLVPLRYVASGIVTRTGERRRIVLPDGSLMELDARSAATPDFSDRQRVVKLEAGAGVFSPADLTGAPALRIQTAHGEARVLSGSAMVRCDDARALCVALAGTTEIVLPSGRTHRLQAGGSAWFGQHGLAVGAAQPHAAAWRNGQLEVYDEPLAQVVAALSRYRAGWLRVSPAAGTLRVTGLYSLDDTDRALDSLRHTLPITVARYGGLVVMIDLATRQA